MSLVLAVLGFAMLLVPGLLAVRVSARRARGTTGISRVLAWLPSLPLLGFGVYVGVLQAQDPTAANLWPLSMALLGIVTAVLFAITGVLQRWLAR